MFYLMNKDSVICSFDLLKPSSWSIDAEAVSYVDSAYFKRHVHSMSLWLRNRIPDIHRPVVRGLKAALGIRSLYELISVTHLISMSDTLWVTESPLIDKWEKISPYTNDLNIEIAKMALNDDPRVHSNLNLVTPEFSTGGKLPKCWSVAGGQRFLLKGDSAKGHESVTEFLCSQLLDYLNIPHVKYTLVNIQDKQYCCSGAFTNEDYGFKSAAAFTARTIDNLFSLYAAFEASDRLRDIFVFDAIVLNPSRSFNDLGFMFNTASGCVSEPAPIFDNGDAFNENRLNFFREDAIEFIHDNGMLCENQIKLCERVKSFEFKPNSQAGVGAQRAEYLTELIHKRADSILNPKKEEDADTERI